jgi:hypothetical protein
LANAISMVPETGVIVAFADNILLLAKSKDDVVSMANGLRCALKAHPAGPLQPKPKYFHAGQPVEFLGHKLTVKTKGVRVEPSDLNLQKFKCRVTSELTKLQMLKPSTRAKRIQKLQLSVSSWMANFKLCDGIDDFKVHWLGRIKWA